MKKILLTIIAIAGVWMNALALDDVPAWQNDWTSAPATGAKFYLYDTTTNDGFMKGNMDKNAPFASSEEADLFTRNDKNVTVYAKADGNTYYLKMNTDAFYTNETNNDALGYARNFTFTQKNGKFAITFKITITFVTTHYSMFNKNGHVENNWGVSSNVYKYEWYLINEKQYNNHMAYKRYYAAATEALGKTANKASIAWRDKYLNLDYKLKDLSTVDHSEEINALTAEIDAWNKNPEVYARMIETETYGADDFGGNWTEGEVVRKFWGGEYNTLCLPFDITVADLESVLGEGNCTDVVEFSSYDGETLKFTTVAGTLSAGTPYMVQVTNDVENAVIPHTGIVTKTVGNVEKDGATFVGTFSNIAKVDNGNYVINGDKYYLVDSDVRLRGFRGYFTIPETEAKTLSFSVEDNEADGITNIESNSNTADGIIYNLAGQRVSGNVKGIVIKNGKKYLMK